MWFCKKWAAFIRKGAWMKMDGPKNGEGCSSFLKRALWRHAGYGSHVLTCGKDRIDLALVFSVWFPFLKELVIAQRFWNAAMIVEAEDDPCFVCTKCGGQKAADHHWIGVWERECGKYLRKPGVKILRRLLVWSESSARVAAGSIRKSRSESAVKIVCA